MGSHEQSQGHMVSAVIFGLVLVTAVFAIFGFLSKNYTLYLPMLIAYGIWVVVALVFFGRGLDSEASHH